MLTNRVIPRSFQSTLPVRGATRMGYNAIRLLDISIHAPREGSDLFQRQRIVRRGISIHAPREGSDMLMRLSILRRNGFQSTLPVRGATAAK